MGFSIRSLHGHQYRTCLSTNDFFSSINSSNDIQIVSRSSSVVFEVTNGEHCIGSRIIRHLSLTNSHIEYKHEFLRPSTNTSTTVSLSFSRFSCSIIVQSIFQLVNQHESESARQQCHITTQKNYGILTRKLFSSSCIRISLHFSLFYSTFGFLLRWICARCCCLHSRCSR